MGSRDRDFKIAVVEAGEHFALACLVMLAFASRWWLAGLLTLHALGVYLKARRAWSLAHEVDDDPYPHAHGRPVLVIVTDDDGDEHEVPANRSN